MRDGEDHREPGRATPHGPGAGGSGSVSAGSLSAGEVEFRGQVAARLRSLRGWLGWTQGELAVKAGVTRNFVSAVECGGIGLDAWRLRLVAHALGTTLDRLLSDSHLNRDLHSDLHSDLPGDLDRDLADGLDSYVERGAGRPEQEAEPFDR